MELWIRSQDRMKLFRGIDFRGVLEQEGCSIIDNTDEYIIGTYKTIERALEVLDEIQKILQPQKIIKTIDNSVKIENAIHIINPTYETITQFETYVYEMPKE